jgi:hypothetical protein
MVWLVIGGPALVVVASFVTLALAVQRPDPALETSAAAEHAPAEDGAPPTALRPALQARNHAPTGGR